MKEFFIRWKRKSERLEQSLHRTFIQTVLYRLRMLFMPLFMIIAGKKFDFYGWRTMKIDQTVFWNPKIESIKRDLQTSFLWNHIEMSGVKSVLEVGSLSGYRLFKAAETFPSVKFFGVDMSEDGVRASKDEATSRNLQNLEFFHFDVTSKEFNEEFSNKEFDVVFSFATLIYIHPTKISELLRMMVKMCQQQLVLVEQSNPNLKLYPFYKGVPILNNPNWMRNYSRLLLRLNDKKPIRINSKSVSSEIWTPGGGHAQLISAKFNG